MSLSRCTLCVAAILAMPLLATAAPVPLEVAVEGIENGKRIPDSIALCTPTADGKSDHRNSAPRPTIRWSGAPGTTKSIAVFMMDPDVPADFTNAGKEGKTLSATAKRQDFFHYGIVNLPADAVMLDGSKTAARPAQGDELPNDLGLNQYVGAPGQFGGPCPPWNDERLHRYNFIVLALDAEAPISVPNPSDSADPASNPATAKNTYNRLIASKHVLAKGQVMGTYTLNQPLRERTE